MICKNCGFKNAAGDQFCGSCGKFLEWAGEPETPAEVEGAAGTSVAESASAPGAAGAGGAAGSTGAAGGGESVDTNAETQVGLSPVADGRSPTTPTPPRPPEPVVSQRQPSVAAGVVCWNCGRQNPASRSFCMQCGERLNTGATAGAVAGLGGAGVPRGPRGAQGAATADGGSGRGRLLAIALALAALLLLAGGAAALFLGGGPGATPTPTAVALPSDSLAPTVSASPNVSPSVSPSASLPPSPSSSASPSPPPTATPTAPPTAPPTPPPTPRPPTPSPSPVHCDDSTEANRFRTFSAEEPSFQINPGRAWCVHQLIFIAQSGEGQLKLYLTNPIFLEQGYSSERIGWHEANMPGDFAGGPEYMPPLDMIQPYRLLPPRTLIELEITCSAATPDCAGIVQLGYDRLSAP